MPQLQGEFDIPKTVLKITQDKEKLKTLLSNGKLPQEILEFSDATMNKFYVAACRIFENKRYVDSVNAFLFLVTMNPFHYDYWIGLGAAKQHCNEYEEAIDAYEMAAICQLDNPLPYFHLAKCLFAMHDRESALQAIDLAIEYASENSGYDEIRWQALAAKALLLKEQ